MSRNTKNSSHAHTVLPVFPALILTILIHFSAPGFVQAETWYVAPSAEIPIRSGQGSQYKILAVVPSGLGVKIVQEDDPWVRVRTPGGTEGWMLKRYLSNEPPLTEVVTGLRSRLEKLQQDREVTDQKYQDLLTAFSRNEQELNTCIRERDETKIEFTSLQEDTADVIRTKKELNEKTRQLENARKELTGLRRKIGELERNAAVKWFLAGGGMLFAGILLGMIHKRSRKRKSSLY